MNKGFFQYFLKIDNLLVYFKNILIFETISFFLRLMDHKSKFIYYHHNCWCLFYK